jgi:hypothetical protein
MMFLFNLVVLLLLLLNIQSAFLLNSYKTTKKLTQPTNQRCRLPTWQTLGDIRVKAEGATGSKM